MNVKKSSIVNENTFLNTFKTIFGIIFPLVTFPYIARVLGVDNIGKINYGNSIVSYFSLIASLGINTYAIRECSKEKENKDNLSKTASQILSINIITTMIAYAALIITLLCVEKLRDYRSLILIQSMSIVFTTMGADWLNTAMEDIKFITIRTVGMQMVSLMLMFLFVKQEGDYIRYAVISVVALSGANIINILYRRKYCKTRFTLHINWKRHLLPIFVLFSMILSQTIFTSSDMTILGLYKDDTQVGLYSASVKLYNMVNQVVASIAWVVMPRLSAGFQNKDYKSVNELLKYALNYIIVLGIPSLVGMNVITKELICTVAGSDYIEASTSMHILSVALLFSFIGGFVGNIILLSSGKDKECLGCSVVGAVSNLVLNLFAIPLWGLNAAACTTAISQFVCFIISCKFVPKEIRIEKFGKMLEAPLVGGGALVAVSLIVRMISNNPFMITALTIVFGVLSYAAVLVMMKNEFFLSIITPVWKRKKRSKEGK